MMSREPYTLLQPEKRRTATIFASPHSGRDYPASFRRSSVLDERTLRSSEDAFVDRLYDCAPEFGAPLLAANFPRAYVDLNRAPDELDPALIKGVARRRHNPRIASGLGVIPRVVAQAREIRQGKISLVEARRRLRNCYHPYHDRLKRLVEETEQAFGQVILFDCHSMPHEALVSTSYAYDSRPEIVLGDRYGAACAAPIIDEVERIFRAAGLRVSRNLPFAGAYVTQQYGWPSLGRHAIQIEIDRSLYMDETRVEPRADFEEFRTLMRGIVSDLVRLGEGRVRLAAE